MSPLVQAREAVYEEGCTPPRVLPLNHEPACLQARETVNEEDVKKAIQLVILPRATITDQPDSDEQPPPPPPPPPPSNEQEQEEEEEEEDEQEQEDQDEKEQEVRGSNSCYCSELSSHFSCAQDFEEACTGC